MPPTMLGAGRPVDTCPASSVSDDLIHQNLLVDNDVLGVLTERLFAADEQSLGLRALVLCTADRWRPLPEETWIESVNGCLSGSRTRQTSPHMASTGCSTVCAVTIKI